MKSNDKKIPTINRFEFRLSADRVAQLQALLADRDDPQSDELLRAWWTEVSNEMGFLSDTATDVRWTTPGGRVLIGPAPVGVECNVSFTAIGCPRGLPVDLDPDFREWLVAAYPEMVWPTIDGGGGTYLHPDALAQAFDAGRNMPNLPESGPLGAKTDQNHTRVPSEDARAVDPVSGISIKSDFLALTTGDPRFDPTAQITVNGFAFVPANAPRTYSRDQFWNAISALEDNRWPNGWARAIIEKVAAALGLEPEV